MAAESSGRKSAPLRTYSRRVTHQVEESSSKKRAIEEVLSVKLLPEVKKFKRSSIQSYFKPVQTSSSPASTRSLHTSSDTLESNSTPPSSPPSRTGSPAQYKSLQRPRRRLQTRPNLKPIAKPITKMSDPSYDGDMESFLDVVGSMEDDTAIPRAEEFLDREEYRDIERSRAVSLPQANLIDRQLRGIQGVRTEAKESAVRSDHRSRASTETVVSTKSNQVPHFLDEGNHGDKGSIYRDMMARRGTATGGPSRRALIESSGGISLEIAPLSMTPVISDVRSKPIDIQIKAKEKSAKVGYQQQLLDLGVNRFESCEDCGMTYNFTEKKDVKLHDKFHRKVFEGTSMKKHSPKTDLWSESIDNAQHSVCVLTHDSSSEWHALFKQALELSYEDMGGLKVPDSDFWSKIVNPHDKMDPNQVPRYKIYVYLIEMKPVGVLLAERIARGGCYYKGPVTHDEFGKIQPSKDKIEATQEYVSKDISYEVFMSVDRIWAHKEHRRKNIATTLVDNARDDFVPGLVLSKRRVAFSLPTSLGTKFAEKYCEGVFVDAPFLVNLDDATSIIKEGMLCQAGPKRDEGSDE